MLPPSSTPARARVAGLRLPTDLPPHDLERLAAVSSSAAPAAPASAPASFGLSPAGKFGNEGSPADVRIYAPAPAAAPLLLRGGVVSPGHGGGSGLVLPNLSLPLSGPASAPSLPFPSVSQPRSAPAPDISHSPITGLSHHHHHHHHLPEQALHVPRRGAPPVHVSRALSHRGAMSRGAVSAPMTAPTSPTNPPLLSQNEIKKAQNRKSAKRFREAQKQRWKKMADDLLIHKRTISELRAQLAAKDACVARANALLDGREPLRGDERRSAMSIHDLVDADAPASSPATSPVTPPAQHGHVEAEASLYAQILSNTAQKSSPEAPAQPYVSELGLLTLSYVVVSHTARVVSIRRGTPRQIGPFATHGLSQMDATEVRTALTCGKPVAVAYSRHNVRVNAVMHPVEASDRIVVAEFSPLN